MINKISVIMPIYNGGDYFKESYQSILAQRIDDFELIVVDDGSSDDSYEVVKEWAVRDLRIKLYRNECNSGVAYSRNYALDNATGEYIAFLDCGDIWLENKLQLQITALETTDSDVCYTGYQYFDEKTRVIIRNYQVPERVTYPDLLVENYVGCSTVVAKRACFERNRFDQAFFHEDYVLWLSLLKEKYNFIGLPTCLVNYRTGGRSANKWRAALNKWRVLRKAEKLSLFQAIPVFIKYGFRMIRKYH